MTELSREALPASGPWTREQLKLAFCLYCETPFGKLHSGNQEIIQLASLIRRTPSSLAMKLVNFASLDPSIIASGRKGLGNASRLDREIWNEFHADWERLVIECDVIREELDRGQSRIREEPGDMRQYDAEDFTGETRATVVQQRRKHDFFRRAVLSGYRGRCCMCGLAVPELLVASHIVPWSADKANRLNPANGLCLSALHDRAFDIGLITVAVDLRVVVSGALRRAKGGFAKSALLSFENQPIELPERFAPDEAFLTYHRKHVFVGE